MDAVCPTQDSAQQGVGSNISVMDLSNEQPPETADRSGYKTSRLEILTEHEEQLLGSGSLPTKGKPSVSSVGTLSHRLVEDEVPTGTSDRGTSLFSPAAKKETASGRRQSTRRNSTSMDKSGSKSWSLKRKNSKKNQAGGMMPDADEMKRRVRQRLVKKKYNVFDFYYETGYFQAIARHSWFENAALSVICLNAVYMAIDADHNKSSSILEADPFFQVCEHAFCVFFTGELLVRFCAFRRKCNCLRDAWFVFDFTLVSFMVLETWVVAYLLPLFGVSMTSGPLANSGILRLLRLLRLSRMSRMLNRVPELVVLLKGIAAAGSSCCWTAMLLVLAMYIWGLALKQLSEDTDFGLKHFDTVPSGMFSLMMTGCFMKGLSLIMADIMKESVICAILYFVFVIFAGVTVMKMLTGMLCKVVNAVAASEIEKMSVGSFRDEVVEVFRKLGFVNSDEDEELENLQITREMFAQTMRDHKAIEAFAGVGVDVVSLVAAADFIFPVVETKVAKHHGRRSVSSTPSAKVGKVLSGGDFQATAMQQLGTLSFADFVEAILELRGTNTATVRDMIGIRKFVRMEVKNVQIQLQALEKACRSSRSSTKTEGSGRSPYGSREPRRASTSPAAVPCSQDSLDHFLNSNISAAAFNASTNASNALDPAYEVQVSNPGGHSMELGDVSGELHNAASASSSTTHHHHGEHRQSHTGQVLKSPASAESGESVETLDSLKVHDDEDDSESSDGSEDSNSHSSESRSQASDGEGGDHEHKHAGHTKAVTAKSVLEDLCALTQIADVANQASMRRETKRVPLCELNGMGKASLCKRAFCDGISEAALDEALDTADVKQALISLILSHDPRRAMSDNDNCIDKAGVKIERGSRVMASKDICHGFGKQVPKGTLGTVVHSEPSLLVDWDNITTLDYATHMLECASVVTSDIECCAWDAKVLKTGMHVVVGTSIEEHFCKVLEGRAGVILSVCETNGAFIDFAEGGRHMITPSHLGHLRIQAERSKLLHLLSVNAIQGHDDPPVQKNRQNVCTL